MKVRCSKEKSRWVEEMWAESSWKGANLQGSWTWTHMNKLERRSRTSTTFVEFSAQKEKKEREIWMFLEAYMWSRWMRMMLEGFLHLIQALDARIYEDLWVCVLGVLGPKVREIERFCGCCLVCVYAENERVRGVKREWKLGG